MSGAEWMGALICALLLVLAAAAVERVDRRRRERGDR